MKVGNTRSKKSRSNILSSSSTSACSWRSVRSDWTKRSWWRWNYSHIRKKLMIKTRRRSSYCCHKYITIHSSLLISGISVTHDINRRQNITINGRNHELSCRNAKIKIDNNIVRMEESGCWSSYQISHILLSRLGWYIDNCCQCISRKNNSSLPVLGKKKFYIMTIFFTIKNFINNKGTHRTLSWFFGFFWLNDIHIQWKEYCSIVLINNSWICSDTRSSDIVTCRSKNWPSWPISKSVKTGGSVIDRLNVRLRN